LFQIGILVALVYNTTTAGFYDVEAFITIYILYLLTFYNGCLIVLSWGRFIFEAIICAMPEQIELRRTGSKRPRSGPSIVAFFKIWFRRLKTEHDFKFVKDLPLSPLVFNVLLTAAIIFYSTWFWWRGIDHLKPTPCGSEVFFFARISLHGWLRWFHRALNILTALILLFELCRLLILISIEGLLRRKLGLHSFAKQVSSTGPCTKEGLKDKQTPVLPIGVGRVQTAPSCLEPRDHSTGEFDRDASSPLLTPRLANAHPDDIPEVDKSVRKLTKWRIAVLLAGRVLWHMMICSIGCAG
jgi:hypothetical protein